ncbi:MAG: hypothetical protein EHM42_01110, partial [Planctomycetaceae bacterium]
MEQFRSWIKEDGPRLRGSRDLDSSKLQSPCIVRLPSGGYRLFYTAVGPAKPYPDCQGYILSAVSDDGLAFEKEPGIRLAPQPQIPHMALRVISPSVAASSDGRWRMYFESRGSADVPTVICSAISSDMLHWELEAGIRLQAPGGVGGVRYLALPDGRGRVYCFESVYGSAGPSLGPRNSQRIVSAISSDGIHFEKERGVRVFDQQSEYDSAGITTAEVIPPTNSGGDWTMFLSAWQRPESGAAVPIHPSQDVEAVANGRSADFAAASIAADMSGFRSRIFVSHSTDGLTWGPIELVLEGEGYSGEGP